MTTSSTIITLSRSAVLHNLREFQKLSPAVAPVLKSDAFGHGLKEMASILDKEKLPFFVVDAYEEAQALRASGIGTPILTIGYVRAGVIAQSVLENVSFAITSFEMLEDCCRTIRTATKVHLKIDTAMHRQGVALDQFQSAIAALKKCPHLIVEGVYSHLPDANGDDPSYTHAQIKVWNDCVNVFRSHFPGLKFYHLSNTAGHAFTDQITANMTRPGNGIYGILGNGRVDGLVEVKPVLEVISEVSGLKEAKAGSRIGYNDTFIAKSDLRLATIPFGYAAGLDRRLSNQGWVKIKNQFARIIGRVSMNVAIIDVSDFDKIEINTPVTVISRKPEELNSLANIALACDTIPEVISTGLSPLIDKVIVD